MRDYESYLRTVEQRLSIEKFEINRGLRIGDFTVDLFGFLLTGLFNPARYGCYMLFLERVDMEVLKRYSTTMFDHTKNHKNIVLGGCYSFSVLASDVFDDEIKAYIGGFDGRHLGRIERPVLAELRTRQIYYFEKKPWQYRVPQVTATDFARKYFAFQ